MDEKTRALWERRLQRERAARKQAEQLLEQKSLELYEANDRYRSEAKAQANCFRDGQD